MPKLLPNLSRQALRACLRSLQTERDHLDDVMRESGLPADSQRYMAAYRAQLDRMVAGAAERMAGQQPSLN